jgi:hypothetical protein
VAIWFHRREKRQAEISMLRRNILYSEPLIAAHHRPAITFT